MLQEAPKLYFSLRMSMVEYIEEIAKEVITLMYEYSSEINGPRFK